MTGLNIKDFLMHGAFLQIGPDLFKVLVGPFIKHNSIDEGLLKHSTLLYMPNFWDFLNPSQNLSQKAVYSAREAYLLDREEFISFLKAAHSSVPGVAWNPIDETQFKYQFDWSLNNFKEDSLKKAVPIICQTGTSDFKSENLIWCIHHLVQTKAFGWSYGFFENQTGLIGHTPEVLAQWSAVDHQLHTVALAGTSDKTPGAAEAMLFDIKIRDEHQLVIEDILTKIRGLSFKTNWFQGNTELLELKYLLHLMTEFQIEAQNLKEVFEIVNSLHPTAAMGIYPRRTSKLQEFSEFSLQKTRAGFAAPFGIVEADSVCCVVAIRNLFFNKEKVKIFSGCGVTLASDYRLEVLELQSKRESVKKMMGLKND